MRGFGARTRRRFLPAGSEPLSKASVLSRTHFILLILHSPPESFESLFDLFGLVPGHSLQIVRYGSGRNAEKVLRHVNKPCDLRDKEFRRRIAPVVFNVVEVLRGKWPDRPPF